MCSSCSPGRLDTAYSAARVRISLDPGQIVHIDSAENEGLNLKCGDKATTLAIGAEPAVTLSAEQTAAIEADVRARLKNHDLAKFSGIAAKSIGPILLVCGYVNAKNSAGGYIGDLAFDGFLLKNEGWSFTALKIDDPSDIPAQQACHDLGLL